jgi:hypothetical protein
LPSTPIFWHKYNIRNHTTAIHLYNQERFVHSALQTSRKEKHTAPSSKRITVHEGFTQNRTFREMSSVMTMTEIWRSTLPNYSLINQYQTSLFTRKEVYSGDCLGPQANEKLTSAFIRCREKKNIYCICIAHCGLQEVHEENIGLNTMSTRNSPVYVFETRPKPTGQKHNRAQRSTRDSFTQLKVSGK